MAYPYDPKDDLKTYYVPYPPASKHPVDNFIDGVIVPGLQAAITGLFSGISAGAVSAWLGLPAWGVGATIASMAALGGWLSYRGHWQWRLERLLNIDLNGDGRIGQPLPVLPPSEPIRIRLESENGRQVDYIDLPYPEKLPAFASGILNGRQFAQTAWVGTGQVFSRAEFDNLRDTLIERGLAAWKNPQAKAQGVELTAAGRAVMRRLADPSPTLPAE